MLFMLYVRLFFISSKSFPIVLQSFSGCTTLRNTGKTNFFENPMTTSPQISSFKIRGVSTATKTQKIKLIGGGKVLNKSCRKWFKILFKFF